MDVSGQLRNTRSWKDERPGLFTKFVANTAGDFTSGTLYVFKQDGGDNGNWLRVPSDMETMVNFKDWVWGNGATYFIRLEWVTIINDKVYIAETGYDNVCKKSSWNHAVAINGVDQVAAHHAARASMQGTALDTVGNSDAPYYDYYGRVLEYDPATDEITVYLEGGPDYAEKSSQAVSDYPPKHLSNPDGLGKITINGRDYMILNEDLNGNSYNRLPADGAGWVCEMYLLDMGIENPVVGDLTRIMVGPNGAELTGGNGTSDGKTILVNVQHPSSSNTAPYNHAVTVALTGWDFYVPSNQKEIISFGIDTVVAIISGTDITATLPYGTDVTALTPTIVVSDLAEISPASGVAQNFSSPVVYTVTAEDETEQEYTATITIGDEPGDGTGLNPGTELNAMDFVIYPNPAVGYLYFNDRYSVAIYNESGELLKSRSNTDAINVSELSTGIYFIKNQKGEVKKLMIK